MRAHTPGKKRSSRLLYYREMVQVTNLGGRMDATKGNDTLEKIHQYELKSIKTRASSHAGEKGSSRLLHLDKIYHRKQLNQLSRPRSHHTMTVPKVTIISKMSRSLKKAWEPTRREKRGRVGYCI